MKSMSMGHGFNKETLGHNTMFVVTSSFWMLAVCKNEGRRPASVANQKQLLFGYVQWILLLQLFHT